MQSNSDVLGRFAFRLSGCSSDWQSTAFGTQGSLVQIQSPRFSPTYARCAGFVVVLAALLACARVGAAQVEPRTMRRGTEDVTIVDEHDGWTEIVLRNGKRALVPSSEVADEAAPPPVPQAKPAPAPGAGPPSSADEPSTDTAAPTPTATPPDPVAELRAEVTRLRAVVDELTALKPPAPDATTVPAEPAPRSWLASESLTMLGLALVIGVLLGGAVQRQRARRSRSLRF